ncbi:MAG: AAA family ATPase [Lachnospiraceae bacterium]|nr:AAA family ATPase [Lachnospiraceae bacterium]
MIDALTLRADYEDLKKLVISRADDAESKADLERYVLGAAYRIWGSDGRFSSDDYVQAVAVITGEAKSRGQIGTEIRRVGKGNPALPACIREYMEAGKHTGAELERMRQSVNNLLTALAFVNGDFTVKEAETVTELMRDLGKPQIAAPQMPNDGGASLVDDSLREMLELNNKFLDSLKTDGLLGGGKIPSMDFSGMFPNPNAGVKPAGGTAEAGSGQKAEEKKEEQKPAEPEKTLDELLEELDSLVGLDTVKEDIHSLLNFIKVAKLREERGMKMPKISYHLVFTGNPGTGKTTIARLVAKIYKQMGLLPQGQLVEADRSSLVAGFVGQTAIKTKEVIDSAMGGVLFIDEAYALASEETDDAYGREAIETILKNMEDHRDKLVVIVAGYTELMKQFIDSNPGLKSRFNKYIFFPEYTGDEMYRIFERFCKSNGYTIEEEAGKFLHGELDEMYEHRGEDFGNARTVRNIFEKAISFQANRIAGLEEVTDEHLAMLMLTDVAEALKAEKSKG